MLVSTGLLLASCHGKFNDFDNAGGGTKKDYESLLGRRPSEKAKAAAEPPIPEFQSVLAAPSAPEFADTRRVSIAVTESTPVRDILIELARKAEVDLEMDQRISGGIIMTANDRPFVDVIERICDLADLRFKFAKNTLKVEVDTPYMEQYHLGVLNIARQSTSEVSSSTDASSASQAIGATGGGGGGSNKSSASVTAKSSADFWGAISTNIRNILAGIQARRAGVVAETAQASFTPQASQAKAAPAGGAAGAASAGAQAPGGAAGAAVNAAKGLAARQDQVSAVLAEEPQAQLSAGPTKGGGGGVNAPNAEFSINPEAGIITVFATQRQHKAIDRYLRDVLNSVNQQVLIEAKILEVQLDDQYSAGINWTAALGPASEKFNLTTNFSRDVVPPAFSNPTFSSSWNLKRGIPCPTAANPAAICSDLTAAAQLVKQFGTVRTLSSPRLTVTNNQMAMLKVAKNQVFFQLTATVTDATATSPSKTNVNSQIKTVPVGIIMSVQPAVDPVTRRISLSLRPSITRITSFIQDPGVQVTIAQLNSTSNARAVNVSSPIPIIETREMDSMVNMDSGDTIVMGGLMQDSSTNIREGIPGAMDIPVIGQALSENVKQNSVSELVVFIRATLVSPRNTVADEDIRLYKTFTPDPRPVAF